MCDFLLGQLLDYFDEHDLWRDTALVVTTDHGFLLGEHDFWAKNRMNLYEEVVAHTRSSSTIRVALKQAGTRCEQSHPVHRPRAHLPRSFRRASREPEMEGLSVIEVAEGRAHRDALIFGYFGGAVNVTDGRYTYHRYPADLATQEIFQYTLMPTHIFEPFSPEELAQATLAEPFPFTKGAKLLKIPVVDRSPMYNVYGPGAMIERDTRLYDLVADPGQETSLKNPEAEARMERLMVGLMKVNHAPSEAFARLGIDLAIRRVRSGSRRVTFPPPQSLAGDLRQLASVRRIVLDDGPERGVRALAFSTGGGLDFWVLVDRSLDIGPLWYRGVPVAWQSPSGFRSPYLHDAERDRGLGFNRELFRIPHHLWPRSHPATLRADTRSMAASPSRRRG